VAIIVVGGNMVAFMAAVIVRRNTRKASRGSSDEDSSDRVRDDGLTKEEREHRQEIIERARSKIPRSLALALTLAQVLGLLGASSEIGWPNSTEQALSVFQFANLDIHFATECSLDSFKAKYILSLAYPLVFVAIAVLACLILRACAPCIGAKVSVLRVLERIVFVGGPLLYIPLARSALVLFDCTKLPNGKYALDVDLSLECFDDTWWELAPYGLAGILLYVVLVPAVIGGVLWGYRKRLLDPTIMARYGSIYKLFRINWAWFELIVLVKKLAIISATLFLSTYPLWMIFSVAAVFGFFAILHARNDVYLGPTYNLLETRLNIAATLILVLAFAFYADRFPSNAAKSVFAYVAIGIVVIAFALLVAAFVKEINGLIGTTLYDVRELEFWRRLDDDAENFADPDLVAAMNEIRSSRPFVIGQAGGSVVGTRMHVLSGSGSSSMESGGFESVALVNAGRQGRERGYGGGGGGDDDDVDTYSSGLESGSSELL